MTQEVHEYIVESARIKSYNLGLKDAIDSILGTTSTAKGFQLDEGLLEDAGVYPSLSSSRKSPMQHDKHKWNDDINSQLIQYIQSGYTVDEIADISVTGFTYKALTCQLNRLGYSIKRGIATKRVQDEQV